MRSVRRRTTAVVAALTALAAVSGMVWLNSSGMKAFADTALTVAATADTTFTQVTQDGDNSGRTTLATCPSLCDTNAAGKRDAFVQFNVTGLPANATRIRAHLRVYTWSAAADATVTASRADGSADNAGTWAQRPAVGPVLATAPSVVAGFNDWDVSTAVTGNASVTFALQQTTHNTRLYWASNDNTNVTLHPQLVLTYVTSTTPTWNLVWSDEFDGTTLDTTKWHARTNTRLDIDIACITNRPQNIIIGGGNLTLRALKENYSCGENRNYTTGYLDTIGMHSWTYGRFEARLKSPGTPTGSTGLWPAFWLRPEDAGQGEIDVVELPGGASYYKSVTQAIFRDYTPTKQDHRWPFPTGNASDGFHTYATEWDANAIVWYIDGVEVWRRDASTTPWFSIFTKPFNIRLNFQVGGWLGNPDAATVFPADFVVDYVRVYQH